MSESTNQNALSKSQQHSPQDYYELLLQDFEAKHGRQPDAKDLVKGLQKRIAGDLSDPVFNMLSPKMAKAIFDEHLEVQTTVVEKATVRKGSHKDPEAEKQPELKHPEARGGSIPDSVKHGESAKK
jgi:hypothetical protein